MTEESDWFNNGELKDLASALAGRQGSVAVTTAAVQAAASIVATMAGVPAAPAIVGIAGGGATWLLTKLSLNKLKVDAALQELATEEAAERVARRIFAEQAQALRAAIARQPDWPQDAVAALRALDGDSDEVLKQISADVALIRRLLHERLPALPNARSRIWAFLDEYLAPKKRGEPVPFGGRDAELGALTAWLQDPEGEPLYLVTAPAGRGKSALLVRWTGKLATRELTLRPSEQDDGYRWHCIFIPISIRFRTNRPEDYHQLLAHALAEIVRPEGGLGQAAQDPAGFYGDRVREYFEQLSESGKRVLVVLDGLDESLRDFDASLLTRVPADSVRILVSARWKLGDTDSTGWVQRLGWEDCLYRARDLDLLSNEAIRDILRKMGAPIDHLADQAQLVRQLAELTEREPLLLSYYAKDLWGHGENIRRLQVEDLALLKPGFGAYFGRWLEDQERHWADTGTRAEGVDQLLSVLAFANGPLLATDLSEVASRTIGKPVFDIVQAMKPLERFVIGDGEGEQGYVLSHPKLGHYLATQRYKNDVKRKVQSAFVGWVRDAVAELNRNADPVADASPYLLQFGAQHLVHANAPLSDFEALVENGWRLAWKRFEGGQEGFSTDVELAWEQAGKGTLEHLGFQLRCALVQSSIRSLAHNIPGSLLVQSVNMGVMTVRQGAHFARLMSRRGDIVYTLAKLAELTTGDEHKADLLSEALATARTIERSESRAAALLDLSLAIESSPGRKSIQDEALEECRRGLDPLQRSRMLLRFAEALSSESGSLAREIYLTSNDIAPPAVRIRMLLDTVIHLGEPERSKALEVAQELASAIDESEARTQTLLEILPMVKASDKRELFSDAYRSFQGCQAFARARLLPALMPFVDEADRVAVCSSVLSALRLEEQSSQVLVLIELVPALPSCLRGEVTALLRPLISEISDDRTKAMSLAKAALVVGEQVSDMLISDAFSLLRSYQNNDDFSRSHVGRENRDHQLPAFVIWTVARILSRERMSDAVDIAFKIRDDTGRADALTGLLDHVDADVYQEVLDAALASAGSIEEGFDRIRAMDRLVHRLSPEQLSQALRASQRIDDTRGRISFSCSFSGILNDRSRQDLMKLALPIARRLGTREGWATSLVRVIESPLGKDCDDGLVAEVMQNIESRSSVYMKGRGFVDLALAVSEDRRNFVVERALEAAYAVPDRWTRVECLTKLSSVLGEEHQRAAERHVYKLLSSAENGPNSSAAISSIIQHASLKFLNATKGIILRLVDDASQDLSRVRALCQLLLKLGPVGQEDRLVQRAVESADAIADDNIRAEAIAATVSVVLPEHRKARLDAALICLRSVKDHEVAARVLATLSSSIQEETGRSRLLDALAHVERIPANDRRGGSACSILPYLPQALRKRGFLIWLEAVASRESFLSGVGHFLEFIDESTAYSLVQDLFEVSDWYP